MHYIGHPFFKMLMRLQLRVFLFLFMGNNKSFTSVQQKKVYVEQRIQKIQLGQHIASLICLQDIVIYCSKVMQEIVSYPVPSFKQNLSSS